jgi:hypothetical protein
VHEIGRAEGKRGIVTVHVEVCFGDRGVILWVSPSVYFTPKMHIKDAG